MLSDLRREKAKIKIWISGSDSVTTAGSSIGTSGRWMGTTWIVAGRIANYLKFGVKGAALKHEEKSNYPKKGMTTSFYTVSNLPKELIAYLKNWGISTTPQSFSGFTGTSAVAYSRPGQPERFSRMVMTSKGNYRTSLGRDTRVQIEGGNGWVTVDPAQYITPQRVRVQGTKGEVEVRAIIEGREIVGVTAKLVSSRHAQPQRFARRDDLYRMLSRPVTVSNKSEMGRLASEAMKQPNFTPSGEQMSLHDLANDVGIEIEALRSRASRPGQPEKFDASSLDRKGFAAASSSPMLGKLLSEKQMPEGGWRAVETGGGALVISFEDGDVAGNFARRVASHGYSATAPVQSIGRYWNVEVKNGK